ncbi:RNA polymerase III subunit Rpc25 [Necator americanus]|uniref:RNA polymerase III subunit Rpc25 n=1 Tax=Necator americanus TaxID=51031 RepID=W2TX58_NECAM|nr:RNA polymerase III subunit Rpc25 [Necator americanus]ETN86408.1 RNA polymerase III subunit Rpc25 [Necator americanus]
MTFYRSGKDNSVMDTMTKAVIPGDTLYNSKCGYLCGRGVYELRGFLRAARVGHVFVKEQTAPSSGKSTKVVEVLNHDGSFTYHVPFIGALVTAKVTEISDKSAKCSIFRIEESNLQEGATFTAVIRKEDMRNDLKLDQFKVKECVLPGDYVLATVISTGDSHYLLSIADSRLGVVAVRNRDGSSWLPPTRNNLTMPRKVALIPNTLPKLDSLITNS